MIYYIVPIIFSCLFFSIGFIFNRNNLKMLSFVAFFLSIIIPSLFAGLRDSTIGVDILVYGNNVFSKALNSENFLSLLNSYNDIEIGYLVLNYIIAKFTNNFYVLYTLVNFVTLIPVYISIFMLKDKLNPIFSLLIYFLSTWLYSFNLLRQSIAVSFIILSIAFLLKKRKAPSLFVFCIASLFHSSVIVIAIIFTAVLFYIKNENNITRYLIVIVGVSFAVLTGWNRLVTAMGLLGIVSQKYIGYLTSYDGSGLSIKLCLFMFIMLLPYLLIFIYKKVYHDKKNVFLVTISLLSVMLALLVSKNYVLFGRLNIYLTALNCITFPLLVNYESNRKKIILLLITILMYLIYMYFVFAESNYGNLFPYTSSFLSL